ncbi:cyclic nucleotide-binding domain-containing protein [Methylacidiphilales bacterium]|nr:cyclic nucleotide-binding domain-containing protein [Candidatus Methylacidiphilales bacterium]
MPQFIFPRIGILAFMDDESRELLNGYGSFLPTHAGQVIIQEGAPQTSLYIVMTGQYNVTVYAADRDIFLDTVEEGDCFGEVSIFQPGPASATVTSLHTGQLWYMGVENLQQYLYDWPYAGCALILGINTILSRRLKRANGVIKTNEIVPSFLSVRAKKRGDTIRLPTR